MTALFSPLALGSLQLPNRVVIAPMCQYSGDEGKATDWHAMHLGQLAQSGAGLLILEATAVEARGRISHYDLGLWNDETEAALHQVLQPLRRYSPIKLGIQLGHAGRKASSQRPWQGGGSLPEGDARSWPTISASAQRFSPDAAAPQAATEADLDQIVQAFVDAALRSARLGFDLIELHAAHGYLMHQFLSPLSNQRTDAYGGSLENRMRLTLRIFDAVKAALADLERAHKPVLGVRISASDWVEGGWNLAQSIELAKALEQRGSDFIHVSSGGLSPLQKIPVQPGYQVAFAAGIKAAVKTPVIAVGLITEARQAQDILDAGQADAIGIARAVLYNPRWPWHAAAALGAKVHAAPQYLRCEPHAAKGLFDLAR